MYLGVVPAARAARGMGTHPTVGDHTSSIGVCGRVVSPGCDKNRQHCGCSIRRAFLRVWTTGSGWVLAVTRVLCSSAVILVTGAAGSAPYPYDTQPQPLTRRLPIAIQPSSPAINLSQHTQPYRSTQPALTRSPSALAQPGAASPTLIITHSHHHPLSSSPHVTLHRR